MKPSTEQLECSWRINSQTNHVERSKNVKSIDSAENFKRFLDNCSLLSHPMGKKMKTHIVANLFRKNCSATSKTGMNRPCVFLHVETIPFHSWWTDVKHSMAWPNLKPQTPTERWDNRRRMWDQPTDVRQDNGCKKRQLLWEQTTDKNNQQTKKTERKNQAECPEKQTITSRQTIKFITFHCCLDAHPVNRSNCTQYADPSCNWKRKTH